MRGVSGTSPRKSQLPMLISRGYRDTTSETSHAGVVDSASNHVTPIVVYATSPSKNKGTTCERGNRVHLRVSTREPTRTTDAMLKRRNMAVPGEIPAWYARRTKMIAEEYEMAERATTVAPLRRSESGASRLEWVTSGPQSRARIRGHCRRPGH